MQDFSYLQSVAILKKIGLIFLEIAFLGMEMDIYVD